MLYDQPHILIEQALASKHSTKDLIKLLAQEETMVEAALNLAQNAEEKALKPIFETFKRTKHPALSFALTHFNCTSIAQDILDISTTVTQESQEHFLIILNGTTFSNNLGNKIQNKISTLVEKEKNSKVTFISNKSFLSSIFLNIEAIKQLVQKPNNIFYINQHIRPNL